MGGCCALAVVFCGDIHLCSTSSRGLAQAAAPGSIGARAQKDHSVLLPLSTARTRPAPGGGSHLSLAGRRRAVVRSARSGMGEAEGFLRPASTQAPQEGADRLGALLTC